MLFSIAHLDTDRLKAVQALEDDIGSPLVAMSTVNANPTALPDDKLEKIRSLEKELGIVLVACQKN
ncbi:hypothetical protein [Aestuariispira ectoiniformans]|uniref:hypothetical protein n=1 Tax=Aestuariispira ectoiniformans TaxID=2775080 RepID=UPI00223AED7D|nr:hypothetical protein [Aestuariispira ectoiniformans]